MENWVTYVLLGCTYKNTYKSGVFTLYMTEGLYTLDPWFTLFLELVFITEVSTITSVGAVFRAEHLLYNIYLGQLFFGQCSFEQYSFKQSSAYFLTKKCQNTFELKTAIE